MPRIPAAIVALLLLSGCVTVDPGPVLEPGACAPRDTEGKARPDLFVQNATGLHLLRHDAGRYARVAHDDRTGEPYGIVAAPGGAYAVWSDHLVRYEGEVKVVAERGGTFGGIDLVNDTLWVAHKGALARYDTQLRPSEVIGFSSGTHKVSHDVLVCGAYALLLDNVVSPVYVYQVDLSDDRVRVLDEAEIECMCHLAAQWVDAEQGTWYVLESGGGQGHMYQALQRFPLGGGDPVRTMTFTAEFDFDGRMTDGGNGWYVVAVAPTEPPLALAWHMDHYWLGRLQVTADALRLDAPLDLGPVDGPAYQRGDLDVRAGVAAVVSGHDLWVVDIGGTPRLLHAQTLDGRADHIAIGT